MGVGCLEHPVSSSQTLGRATPLWYCWPTQVHLTLCLPPWALTPFSTALATDRVANLLLAYKGRSSTFAPGRAAEDIARQTARDVLAPLLDAACARLAFVLKRVIETASDRAMASGEVAGLDRSGDGW